MIKIKQLVERFFRPEKKSGKRPPVFVYVGYLLVATVIFTGVTFSGYISTTMGNDQARVAKFEIKETGVQEILLGANRMLPGDIFSTPIKIQNSSEVRVELTITATLMHDNLPLDLTIDSVDATAGCVYYLDPGSPEQVYNLTVSWPGTLSDPIYAGMTDMIRVIVNVVQED